MPRYEALTPDLKPPRKAKNIANARVNVNVDVNKSCINLLHCTNDHTDTETNRSKTNHTNNHCSIVGLTFCD